MHSKVVGMQKFWAQTLVLMITASACACAHCWCSRPSHLVKLSLSNIKFYLWLQYTKYQKAKNITLLARARSSCQNRGHPPVNQEDDSQGPAIIFTNQVFSLESDRWTLFWPEIPPCSIFNKSNWYGNYYMSPFKDNNTEACKIYTFQICKKNNFVLLLKINDRTRMESIPLH